MSVTATQMPTLSTPASVDPSPYDEELIIQARKGWIAIDWKELARFRELLFYLIWRDVKVRYKQTVLGVAWAVLQPLFNMVMMTIIFGRIANLGNDLPSWLPYHVWLYVGLLPWTLISVGIATGGMSLVNSQNLLTKIYFPRLFVPAAVIGGALVDMVISFGVLLILMAFSGALAHLSVGIVLLPVLLLLTAMISLGFANLLSALTVTYRDFRFVVPFLAQAMMYLSFFMVPLSRLKHPWELLVLSINPCFGVIAGYRCAFFGLEWNAITITCLLISSVTATMLCLLGLFYFRKTERRFADIA